MVKSNSKQAMDVLAQWAGEEFVASGRAASEDRSTHRSRAQFLVEMLRKLRRQDAAAVDWTQALIEDRQPTAVNESGE